MRTVSEMCPKKQFYHHKNVWMVSIVKFEFLGYNGLKPVLSSPPLPLSAPSASDDDDALMLGQSAKLEI